MQASPELDPTPIPTPVPVPRRSVLYVPGSNPRALEKAPGLPADAFIFDLEDAVAPDAKAGARAALAAALPVADFGGRPRAVRINGLDSAWGEADVAFLASLPRTAWDAVVLPKVNGAEQVAALRARLPANVPVWCMLETPRGVLAAAAIAAAPGVAGLVAGTNDLAKDLGTRPHPERLPLLHALSHIVLAARATGVFALDGVCNALDDAAAFEREAEQGAVLGFDGKTLIHPRTIDAANRVFAPDPAEVAAARRVVEAFARASAEGRGVVVVDGRLVEALHVEQARRRLALAERLGLG